MLKAVLKFHEPVVAGKDKKGRKLCIIKVQVDETIIVYKGVDLDTFIARDRSYRSPSRRHQLLTWCRRNCISYQELGKDKIVVKPTQQPLKVVPKVETALVRPPNDKGKMIAEVEKQLIAKGYTLVKRKTTTPMGKCASCGRISMVGGWKKTKFVGVCFHRYNSLKPCNAVKVYPEEKVKEWLAKQQAA